MKTELPSNKVTKATGSTARLARLEISQTQDAVRFLWAGEFLDTDSVAQGFSVPCRCIPEDRTPPSVLVHEWWMRDDGLVSVLSVTVPRPASTTSPSNSPAIDTCSQLLADHRWLLKHRRELQAVYAGKYVAIHAEQVIADSTELSSLRQMLDALGRSDDSIVEFFEAAGSWIGVS